MAACGKRDRLDRHMAAAAPVGAPAGTRFLPFVFEVHGGCTGDTAREIRHLLNAWSEQNGYDETRCAVNRHAWRYYIACACLLTPSRRRCAGSPSLWLPLSKPAPRARTR